MAEIKRQRFDMKSDANKRLAKAKQSMTKMRGCRGDMRVTEEGDRIFSITVDVTLCFI